MQEKNIGSVVQIIGPVLDIRFPAGHLPDLLNAIEIERDGGKLVCSRCRRTCPVTSSVPSL